MNRLSTHPKQLDEPRKRTSKRFRTLLITALMAGGVNVGAFVLAPAAHAYAPCDNNGGIRSSTTYKDYYINEVVTEVYCNDGTTGATYYSPCEGSYAAVAPKS